MQAGRAELEALGWKRISQLGHEFKHSVLDKSEIELSYSGEAVHVQGTYRDDEGEARFVEHAYSMDRMIAVVQEIHDLLWEESGI
jgi:hypothetical protein